MEKLEFEKLVASSTCRSDICRKLGLWPNGSGFKKLNAMIAEFGVSISHFDPKVKVRKYQPVVKNCPVCGVQFKTKSGAPREKMTCSYKCSNTHFRSGTNNGNWKSDEECSYATLCWRYHKKCCAVCNECLVVEIHHYNGDHEDNRPENFVPLCPTHHQYWHSRHRGLIQAKIDEYMKNWVWANSKPSALEAGHHGGANPSTQTT